MWGKRQEKGLLSQLRRPFKCFGRESNPYGHCCPRDFKSRVSTYSTTKAIRDAKINKIRDFAHIPMISWYLCGINASIKAKVHLIKR